MFGKDISIEDDEFNTQEEEDKSWNEYFDNNTGKFYYHNEKTNKTQWEIPKSFELQRNKAIQNKLRSIYLGKLDIGKIKMGEVEGG